MKTLARAAAFVRLHPARVYGVAVALLVLVKAYGIDLPQEAWLGLLAAVLVLVGGEAVQRVEDRKTDQAARIGAQLRRIGAADDVP